MQENLEDIIESSQTVKQLRKQIHLLCDRLEKEIRVRQYLEKAYQIIGTQILSFDTDNPTNNNTTSTELIQHLQLELKEKQYADEDDMEVKHQVHLVLHSEEPPKRKRRTKEEMHSAVNNNNNNNQQDLDMDNNNSSSIIEHTHKYNTDFDSGNISSGDNNNNSSNEKKDKSRRKSEKGNNNTSSSSTNSNSITSPSVSSSADKAQRWEQRFTELEEYKR
ncbi:hypothetical protein HMI54_010133 [Coelomomyces lativittatus]|nr:hypothetical protein HMI54_010133 [Coelomomyces lativittatus]